MLNEPMQKPRYARLFFAYFSRTYLFLFLRYFCDCLGDARLLARDRVFLENILFNRLVQHPIQFCQKRFGFGTLLFQGELGDFLHDDADLVQMPYVFRASPLALAQSFFC